MKLNHKKNKITKNQSIIFAIIAAILLSLLIAIFIILLRHTHSFGEWETVRDASCTQYGLERRYCGCGEIQERKYDKLAHTEGDWKYNEEENRLEKICTVCDKILETNSLENHTHAWGEYSVKSEPTCTDTGVRVRVCSCGAEDELLIAAIGHDFGEWEIQAPAACNIEGISERVCISCQKSESKAIPPLTHTEGNWIISENEKQYPCIYCNEILRSETLQASEYLDIHDGELVGIGTCEDTEIVIPTDVHTIDGYSFEYQELTGITILNSVTSIEENAFYQCSKLSNIYFGNSLTSIGKRAFYKCESLTQITLPESLTHLDAYAFAYCTNLETVYLEKGITKLNIRVFAGCTNLKSIYYNGTVEDWNAVEKDEEWDLGSSDYIVYCIDGNIE